MRPIKVTKKTGQTDGRQTVTLRLPLDAASVKKHCVSRGLSFNSGLFFYRIVCI